MLSVKIEKCIFPCLGKGYKQMKAKLGMRKVRPWKWMPFSNPARTDGAVFHHWRRISDEGKEYPFAKFNKVFILFFRFLNYIYLNLQI